MSNTVDLTFINFMSELIFYPDNATTNEEKTKAKIITLAVGFFTFGIVHAVVGLGWMIRAAVSWCQTSSLSEEKIATIAKQELFAKQEEEGNASFELDQDMKFAETIKKDTESKVSEVYSSKNSHPFIDMRCLGECKEGEEGVFKVFSNNYSKIILFENPFTSEIKPLNVERTVASLGGDGTYEVEYKITGGEVYLLMQFVGGDVNEKCYIKME